MSVPTIAVSSTVSSPTLPPIDSAPTPAGAEAVPMFRRHLSPHVVPGEGVYLVSERGVSVVNGTLAARLAPLLDGARTVAEIVAELAPIPPERVTHAIDTLIRNGWACFAPSGGAAGALAYWEMNGADGDVALSNL